MAHSQKLSEALPGIWRVFCDFWPWIQRQRALIAGSLLALFAGVGLKLLEPWPLKFVFDRIIPVGVHGGQSGVAWVDALEPITLLTLAALAVVVITGLRAFAEYRSTFGFALIGTRVLTEVRNDLYRHLQTLSLSFHTKARGGDLVLRVIGDTNLLKHVAATAVLPLMASALVLVGMLGIMVWLDWRLTLAALATVPLFWLTTVRLSRRIHEAARKQRARESALAATATESLTAIKVVQALSLEKIFAEDFRGRSKKSQNEEIKTSRLSAKLERTVDLLVAVSTALVLWLGARAVLRGDLTPGDLLVFLAYLRRAFNPVQDLAKYAGRMAKAAAAGERVIQVLRQKPEVRDLPGAVVAVGLRGAVRFDHVSFAYELDRPVLENIDFEVLPGQHIALAGPSGIGKSTLLGLLLRLYDSGRGRVLLDGRDLREYTVASLRSQVSVVLQDSLLFAASVRDNIAYGAGNVTREEVEAAARLANADEFIRALPQGYDTILGERGLSLSHGQRQRIAIARAAIRKSPVLLLDEPTTGLDEENERAVTEALLRLAQGRTTLIVTHNLLWATRADLILYLEEGRVLERGAHAELMRAGGRYAAIYALQAAAHKNTPAQVSHAVPA